MRCLTRLFISSFMEPGWSAINRMPRDTHIVSKVLFHSHSIVEVLFKGFRTRKKRSARRHLDVSSEKRPIPVSSLQCNWHRKYQIRALNKLFLWQRRLLNTKALIRFVFSRSKMFLLERRNALRDHIRLPRTTRTNPFDFHEQTSITIDVKQEPAPSFSFYLREGWCDNVSLSIWGKNRRE